MLSIRTLFTSATLLASTISYAQDAPMKEPHSQTYSYAISFAPVQITENGFGLALAYEKFLDKSGLLSINIPAILTFNPSTDNINNNPRMDPMVYLQPGIKIYTNMSSSDRGKLSLGPNLVFGMGSGRTSHIYPGNTTAQHYQKRDRLMMGAMGTIGGNLFIAKYLYIGFDFSLGCAYVNIYDGENTGVIPLVQTGFRIGIWQ